MVEVIRVPPTLDSVGCPAVAGSDLKAQYQIVIRLENIAYELARMNELKISELENK